MLRLSPPCPPPPPPPPIVCLEPSSSNVLERSLSWPWPWPWPAGQHSRFSLNGRDRLDQGECKARLAVGSEGCAGLPRRAAREPHAAGSPSGPCGSTPPPRGSKCLGREQRADERRDTRVSTSTTGRRTMIGPMRSGEVWGRCGGRPVTTRCRSPMVLRHRPVRCSKTFPNNPGRCQ